MCSTRRRVDQAFHRVDSPRRHRSCVCRRSQSELSHSIMFTKPRPSVTRSDSGFEFEVLTPYRFRYSENGRDTSLSGEAVMRPSYGWMIRRESLREWSGGDAISEAEQDRILDNIRDALKFDGLVLIVDPDDIGPLSR